MTENEVIETLTFSEAEKKIFPMLVPVYEAAIKALEEVQQYRAIGTLEECLAAVEKQAAKKPVTYKGTNRADCPICGATVRGISKPFGDWCSNCGQKLDWSDEE